MYPDAFVPHAADLHTYFPSRKVKLDIQDAFLPDQIFFLYSDGRDDEPDPRCTNVHRLARQERVVASSGRSNETCLGCKTNFDRNAVFFPGRGTPLGDSAAEK